MSKKQLIIDSAKRLFNDNGYAGTNLFNIAEKSGLKLSVVKYHFKNKQILLMMVLYDLIEQCRNYFNILLAHDFDEDNNVVLFWRSLKLFLGANNNRLIIFFLQEKDRFSLEKEQYLELWSTIIKKTIGISKGDFHDSPVICQSILFIHSFLILPSGTILEDCIKLGLAELWRPHLNNDVDMLLSTE